MTEKDKFILYLPPTIKPSLVCCFSYPLFVFCLPIKGLESQTRDTWGTAVCCKVLVLVGTPPSKKITCFSFVGSQTILNLIKL